MAELCDVSFIYVPFLTQCASSITKANQLLIAIRSLETAYNNLIRKIWNLPRRCHTAILHRVARVCSIYNYMIITRCKKLVASDRNAKSQLLSDVFMEATTLVYTNVGYNFLYAKRHWRSYSDSEELCARFICDARMYPELNHNISDDITLMCCA